MMHDIRNYRKVEADFIKFLKAYPKLFDEVVHRVPEYVQDHHGDDWTAFYETKPNYKLHHGQLFHFFKTTNLVNLYDAYDALEADFDIFEMVMMQRIMEDPSKLEMALL